MIVSVRNLTIREFDSEDISGVVAVHCSLIEKWWKDHRKALEASYDDLSPLERWDHGGWWLTEEYALPYEKWLNETVGKSYVAKIEEDETHRIVGHCDLVFSREPDPWGQSRSTRNHSHSQRVPKERNWLSSSSTYLECLKRRRLSSLCGVC